MLITPFSSQDIKKLKDLADSDPDVRLISVALYNACHEPDAHFELLVERVADTGASIWINKTYTTISKLFYMDLEEMPLFVNNDHPDVRLIAKWRLSIAK